MTHQNFLHALKHVAHSKPRRNRVIKKASKSQINCIRNLCHNVCRRKFQLPDKLRRRLQPFRRDIRDLSNKKKFKTIQGAKKRLIHRGGFLPILLPAIVGLLSSVGSKLIERAIPV